MRGLIKTIVSLMLMLLFLSSSVFAEDWVVKGGEVKFVAVGKPGFLKIKGISNGKSPTGSLQFQKDQMEGKFEFTLDNLDTEIELRNKHMKDKYLETNRFPVSTLLIKSFPFDKKKMVTDFKILFHGDLFLHGITKEVRGECFYFFKENKVQSHFTLSLKDFGIDIPKYLGVTVAENVDVDVVLLLQKGIEKSIEKNKK